MSDIKNFIKRFHVSSDIDTVFTFGCCYWFAVILSLRFPDGEIMYDCVLNHFGTKINDRVYDITGDVTDKYEWELWSEFSDELWKSRIIKDCINF